MADEIDRANKAAAAHLRAALDAQRANANQQTGTDECVECGDDIPEARKLANPNACRCIDCQEFFEKRRGTR